VLELYNTLTKQVEAVRAGPGGLLRMYSCGPGAGRRPDLGDLRSGLLADLIRRNAEHRHRLTVLTCQGISDSATGGAQDEADAFRADCSALNLRPAEQSPRASQWPGLMTDLIARLIEGGHAYPDPGGSVYFDARSFAGHGDLCGQPSADWPLWTGVSAGRELASPAPWGAGFPARSTECSALSLHHLGEVIDIHAGGIELCFPHHEHERAVSDSVTGRAVVRQWAHSERLRFDGAALATSGDSAPRLSDLAGRGLDPLALRLAFLGQHYRQPLDLSWDALAAADRTLRGWRELVAEWACSPSKAMPAPVTAEINAAFDADLDTPAALRALAQLERDPQAAPGAKFELFAHADQLLGLDLAREIGRAPARPAPPVAPLPRNESPI
jgi:cysteinyl-tRNA synthetase